MRLVFDEVKTLNYGGVSILIQVLGFHMLDEVDTLNYEGMGVMPPVLAPIPFHTVFSKIVFAKSNLPLIYEIYIAREI